MRRRLRIALVGAGFIGRSHALAIRAVNGVFADAPFVVEPHILADVDAARAEAAAAAFGFAHATTAWTRAVDEADLVIIAVPSGMHRAIAERAIAAGKPFLCEKPVGLESGDAEALARAAAAAKVPHAVGYSYARQPMVRHAGTLLASGRLGRPVHFYGRHFEDYLASPSAPFSWRLARATAGRCGALGDLGCHIISVARQLVGPIEWLSGSATIVHPRRPIGDGSGAMREVENEDHASALVRFADGVPGVIEVSRVALGRKQDFAFELTCERGTVRFDSERMNELSIYLDEPESGEAGFRRVLINPSHPDYAGFLPAPGHGLGFNDLKTIELKMLLDAVASGTSVDPDLAEAARIGRICEAILDSAASGRPVERPEELAPSVSEKVA